MFEDAEEAIAHINQHGSGHTDPIVTEAPEAATQFLEQVDPLLLLAPAKASSLSDAESR